MFLIHQKEQRFIEHRAVALWDLRTILVQRKQPRRVLSLGQTFYNQSPRPPASRLRDGFCRNRWGRQEATSKGTCCSERLLGAGSPGIWDAVYTVCECGPDPGAHEGPPKLFGGSRHIPPFFTSREGKPWLCGLCAVPQPVSSPAGRSFTARRGWVVAGLGCCLA